MDKHGNTIKGEFFDKDNSLQATYTYDYIYTYDGRLIEKITYYNVDISTKIKYVDNFRIMFECTTYKGLEVSTSKNKHNNEGRFIGSTTFDKNGGIIFTSKAEYDAEENSISFTIYNPKGEIRSTTHFELEYDEKQNWIKHIEYYNGILSKVTERKIEYFL